MNPHLAALKDEPLEKFLEVAVGFIGIPSR
jgi:hypothetical protein